MLDKVRIDCSPLTGQLRLARVGKDKSVAIETRECDAELKAAFIAHIMFSSPTGTEETGVLNGASYTIRVVPKAQGSDVGLGEALGEAIEFAEGAVEDEKIIRWKSALAASRTGQKGAGE